MSFLKKLFGLGPKVDFGQLLEAGAVIVDVRTPGEFRGGHIKGAVNMPLNTLKANVGKLKKNSTVITCCASGMRSASAVGVLKSSGFQEVYNGGGWMQLQNKL